MAVIAWLELTWRLAYKSQAHQNKKQAARQPWKVPDSMNERAV
jgi:hypothetical protein